MGALQNSKAQIGHLCIYTFARVCFLKLFSPCFVSDIEGLIPVSS
jgi:hypothetical protein